MKIVFIQPKLQFRSDVWEAGGIGSIIAYSKTNLDIPLNFSFYSGFYDSDEDIIEGCKDADIIGFGSSSPQFKHAITLARQIKTPNNKIVFGGFHATALPELVLKEGVVDAVVIGEGERAFAKLVEDKYNGALKSKAYYTAPLIDNLDTLSFPDRFTINNERNIQQAFSDEGIRITSILSSRGCPYRCAFCSGHAMFGYKTRFRSIPNILDEVEQVIRDWNIDFLKFSDETFTLGKDRIKEFCELKKSRGIQIPFGANAHPASLSDEMIKDLASAGCKELWFGVESGSPKILRDMKKGSDLDRLKELFVISRKYGIKRRAYVLLGMPNETLEDIRMTEDLCDELDPDIVGFTLLAPYPKNEFFNYEVMENWDWSMIDHYVHNNWVHTNTLSNEELKEIQKRLTEKYRDRLSFRQRDGKVGDRYKA